MNKSPGTVPGLQYQPNIPNNFILSDMVNMARIPATGYTDNTTYPIFSAGPAACL